MWSRAGGPKLSPGISARQRTGSLIAILKKACFCKKNELASATSSGPYDLVLAREPGLYRFDIKSAKDEKSSVIVSEREVKTHTKSLAEIKEMIGQSSDTTLLERLDRERNSMHLVATQSLAVSFVEQADIHLGTYYGRPMFSLLTLLVDRQPLGRPAPRRPFKPGF